MLHQPAAPSGKDPASPYKTVLGLWMFLAYALIYLGFVLLNIITPKTLETKIIFGLNLAVVYGMGLIVVALVLAMIYNLLCEKKEKALAEIEQQQPVQQKAEVR